MLKNISVVFFGLLWASVSCAEERAVAIFAGGCFWCMEKPFDVLDGVSSTTSGYVGGHLLNPTYEQVSAGASGHAEAVKVVYDPSKISYEQLLNVFWHNIDPLDPRGQFCDKGNQYRSAIFYLDEQQRQLATKSREAIAAELGAPLATALEPAGKFYPAEGYHQDYYLHNPIRYKFYRHGCGRDARLQELWGDK